MSYSSKNHSNGPDELVIGGKLTIEEGAELMENQKASTASTVAGLKEDLNALLTKLKACGLMAKDSV